MSEAENDLSLHHKPLTQIFQSDRPDAAYSLTDDQIEEFNETGFLAGIRILSDLQVETLRAELTELMKPEQADNPLFYEYHHNESTDADRTLFHALGAWRVSEAFHDLIFHRAMTVPAAQLLSGPVRFWHDQLFVKPAHDGAVVAWHQDYSTGRGQSRWRT